MARNKKRQSQDALEPSQRQLRAGELIRHALTDIVMREEFRDPDLNGENITIGEVRMSPDLKHANIFCSPLGESDPDEQKRLAKGLNRASSFIRVKLGQRIDMKFTPQLNFIADQSYDEAHHMDAIFNSPEVKRDLD